MKRTLEPIALGFAELLAFLAVGCFVNHRLQLARDTRAYPPPGQLVDVGGYRMHIHCGGEGEPALVLEGGTGEWSTYWRPIQPALAETTRVCAYDRAGMGWSDEAPADVPRTAQQIAVELELLLRQAGIPGLYVLAAYSAGGLYSGAFVQRFPQLVVGLVMADASHESLFVPLPELFSGRLGLFRVVAGLLAPLGIVRAKGILPPARPAVPSAEQVGARVLARGPQFCTLLGEKRLRSRPVPAPCWTPGRWRWAVRRCWSSPPRCTRRATGPTTLPGTLFINRCWPNRTAAGTPSPTVATMCSWNNPSWLSET